MVPKVLTGELTRIQLFWVDECSRSPGALSTGSTHGAHSWAQTQRSPRTGGRVRTATSQCKIEDVEYVFTAVKLYELRLAALMASLLSV